MTIRYFEPKKQLTLYDARVNKEIRGSLYFSGTKTQGQLVPKHVASLHNVVLPRAVLQEAPIDQNRAPIGSVTNIVHSEDEKPVQSNRSAFKRNRIRWYREQYYRKKRRNNPTLKVLALLCLSLSVFGFTILSLPVAVSEANFQISKAMSPKISEQLAISQTYPKDQSTAIDSLPSSTNFKIIIPKINLSSDVIPNIDPTDKKIYSEELKKGVAHAKGSYLPGENGPIFIFAHSTDSPLNILQYNAKFYAIKDLNIGDEIDIDYHGKYYTYIVSDKQLSKPEEIDKIRNSDANLILQTCWPPGTNWERLLIFAKQVN